MTVATMDDDVFREFRKIGFSEEIAAKLAKVIRRDDRRDDEFVTRADHKAERESEREAARAERKTERETERDAARAVRDAERAADREAFAAKGDVAVLQSEMTDVKSAILRIDEAVARIDKTAARTDEKVNGLQKQVGLIVRVLIAGFVPLQLATLGALFALLTKGSLWGVAP